MGCLNGGPIHVCQTQGGGLYYIWEGFIIQREYGIQIATSSIVALEAIQQDHKPNLAGVLGCYVHIPSTQVSVDKTFAGQVLHP